MEMNTYRPILVSQKAANLLIFQPHPEARREAVVGTRLPDGLYDALQRQFGQTLRILKIDNVSHPEVMASFGVSQSPTFVLVQKGAEIWRQEGVSDFDQLLVSLQDKVDSLPAEILN